MQRQTPVHHNLGEEPKLSNRKLRRSRQHYATPNVAARYKPKRQLELLLHGTITIKPHTRDRRPPALVVL